MKRKIIIIGIVIIICGGITLKLIANKRVINEQKKIENKEIVIPVTTIITSVENIQHKMVKSGTLIPYKEADITAVSAGKLTSVRFELGTVVSKGQILATVDNEGLELNLAAAQLTKEKAEKDYERAKILLEGDATTTMNFQDAKFNFENAENKIHQIQKQIADNQIKAPISGQIISKAKEAGEYISPGAVLGHIVETNRLKVDVMVSEVDVYHLKTNDPVKITTDIYPKETFTGNVIFISHKGDEVHNYQVEVAINNKKSHPLKAGSFAYVDFEQESKENILLIPKSALIESLDHPKVYVVENGKAKVKAITTGETFGNNIAVVGGLEKGEEVITSGLVNISEGTPVQPVKNN